MKNTQFITRTGAILCLLMLFCVLPASAKKKNKANDGTATAAFVEKVYDFGAIPEDGGPVSHDFEFTNTGDANLVIFEATAECGCTRPDYPKNPIAPGKTNKVKVTYLPLGRPGSFEKVVAVKTNGDPRKVRLKIRGTVTPK